jgi:hypothetical protein
MILIGLAALGFIGAAFANSAAAGVITLFVIAPLVSLRYLTYVRVLLELVIAIFRIMESNVELVALQRERSPMPPSGPSVQPASAPPPPPIA